MLMLRIGLFVLSVLVFARSAPADPPAPEVIGLHVQRIPDVLYAHLPKLSQGQGLLVTKVASGSPGERLGLKPHDILVSLGSSDPAAATPLTDSDHFARMLFALGDQSTLRVIRAGQEMKVLVALKGDDLPKSLAKPGVLPDVTIKAEVVAKNKFSVTFIYFGEGSGKRETLTLDGSLPEIERRFQEVAPQRRLSPRVQDLISVALKRLRDLED